MQRGMRRLHLCRRHRGCTTRRRPQSDASSSAPRHSARSLDKDDRTTAILFGDAAAAVVLEARDDHQLILSHDIGVDGSAFELIVAEHGGFIKMEGKEVFRRAVRVEIASIEKVLDRQA